MKKTLLFIISFCIPLLTFAEEYYITNIYEKVDLPYNTKVITRWNKIEEADYALVPTKIEQGKYSVRLTRVDQGFYKIEGTKIYLEIKYCYEYCYSEEVILVIDGMRGKVIF